LDLIQIHLHVYMTFGTLQGIVLSAKPYDAWPEGAREIFAKLIGTTQIQCAEASMPLAVRQTEDILKAINKADSSFKDVVDMVKELMGRINHYLEGRTALTIPEAQKRYFDQPIEGWEEILEAFPGALDNFEEASRCLALGRNTACVYHLSGIVQEALEAVSRELSIPLDPTSDTWNGLISKINKAVEGKQLSEPREEWKANEAFYAELLQDLKAIKNAWRNPTMHFRRTYSDGDSIKAYARVQEFMDHISTRMKSKQQAPSAEL
jgi:hypothetical protein